MNAQQVFAFMSEFQTNFKSLSDSMNLMVSNLNQMSPQLNFLCAALKPAEPAVAPAALVASAVAAATAATSATAATAASAALACKSKQGAPSRNGSAAPAVVDATSAVPAVRRRGSFSYENPAAFMASMKNASPSVADAGATVAVAEDTEPKQPNTLSSGAASRKRPLPNLNLDAFKQSLSTIKEYRIDNGKIIQKLRKKLNLLEAHHLDLNQSKDSSLHPSAYEEELNQTFTLMSDYHRELQVVHKIYLENCSKYHKQPLYTVTGHRLDGKDDLDDMGTLVQHQSQEAQLEKEQELEKELENHHPKKKSRKAEVVPRTQKKPKSRVRAM